MMNPKLRILKKRINQYRTLKTFFVMFPSEIDIKTLEIESYTKIQAPSKLKGLTIWNFNTISLLREVDGFFHCVGYSNSIGYQIILVNK